MKYQDIKTKNIKELRSLLLENVSLLFKTRSSFSDNSTKVKSSQVREIKKDIARLRTALASVISSVNTNK